MEEDGFVVDLLYFMVVVCSALATIGAYLSIPYVLQRILGGFLQDGLCLQ